MNLDRLPNIGKTLVCKHEKVGIQLVGDLKKAELKEYYNSIDLG